MDYLVNLFTRNNITKTKKYKCINYNYKCNYCETNKVKIDIIRLTEAFYGPFVDSSGNTHECHDRNEGEVKLTCENNHVSIVDYIACCECGWNNKS